MFAYLKRGDKMRKSTYIAIDLKSFYASVECVERKLDPLTTNLVVADASRTNKTICLAVSPSLKSYGIPGRPRLFEVVSKVNEVNSQRRWYAPGRRLTGSTYNDNILKQDCSLALDYIVAPPRMALYVDYSTRIYGVYLKYFAPEDIHVYSIDEVYYAIVEENGMLTVVPKADNRPLTLSDLGKSGIERGIAHIIISDGRIDRKGLERAGLTEARLLNHLKLDKVDVSDVFLMLRDDSGKYTVILKDKKS